MRARGRVAAALGAVIMAGTAIAVSGQSAIPTQGGRGGRGQPQGQRGGGPPQPSNLPATPVVSPLATISAEVTSPGRMLESLME